MPLNLDFGLHRSFRLAALVAVLLCVFSGFVVVAQEANENSGAAMAKSEIARLASRSLLLDATQQGNRLIVVGDRGHVLVSDVPEASEWTQIVVPTRSMLTAITASPNDAVAAQKHLWAVGHDAVILHSDDGGRSWQLQNHEPELEAPLLDVWFEDGGHGFAVGAYGLMLETLDAGETWERRRIDDEEPHFYGLFETADGDLILAGEFGAILRSRDRGGSWSRLETPYEGSFFGGIGLSDGTLLLFGLRGNLFRSVDDGDSWSKIETGVTASLLGAAESGNGDVAIVGLSGTLLISRDSGKSASLIGGLKREGFSTVLSLSDGQMLLVGESGVSLLGNAVGSPASGSGQ